MYYPDEIVEEVIARNDIVDVISAYVRLSRKGSNYFGLCPFHSEKTGSFSVTPSKQMFYCFGCHQGGNVITFIQKHENMTFGEAVRLLADRAGMQLPESANSEARERENRRAQLLAINREAAKYYYALLRNPAGVRGMDYFRGRGLTDETMQRFGLGFAKSSKDELLNYLRGKGYSDDLLNASGLFNFREKSGMTDKFWNRVMFPIMDSGHRVVAFGGRVMGDGEPKYLNSPETLIFDKSRNLYGLNFAKTTKAKNIILCEGYMDVIALHQAGFDQAVASLGTAFPSGQVNLIARYAKENVRDGLARYKDILLCYDSDGPGIDAIKRALLVLREAGLAAKVINMSPYKDPDEFIKGEGAGEFQKRIDEAENGFMYEIRMLENEYDMKDPSGKSRFITDVCARLLTFSDPVERDSYLGLVSYKYDVSVDSLNEVIRKQAVAGTGIRINPKPAPTRNTGADGMDDAARIVQGRLLAWICDSPGIYSVVRRYINADDFADPLYRKVAQIMFERIDNGNLNPAEIIGMFDDEEEQRQVAEAFHQNIGDLEPGKMQDSALRDLMLNIKRLSLTRDDREGNEFETIKRIRKELEELEHAQISITGI